VEETKEEKPENKIKKKKRKSKKKKQSFITPLFASMLGLFLMIASGIVEEDMVLLFGIFVFIPASLYTIYIIYITKIRKELSPQEKEKREQERLERIANLEQERAEKQVADKEKSDAVQAEKVAAAGCLAKDALLYQEKQKKTSGLKDRLDRLQLYLSRETRWLSLLVACTTVSVALIILSIIIYLIGGINSHGFSVTLIIFGALFMSPGLIGVLHMYRQKRVREGKARAFMSTPLDESGDMMSADDMVHHATPAPATPDGEFNAYEQDLSNVFNPKAE